VTSSRNTEPLDGETNGQLAGGAAVDNLYQSKGGCVDKKHCVGCRDNFYNGNNDLGVRQCWSLKSAKLVMRKEVHVDQVPPWNQEARELPDCYRKPRFIYVDPSRKY